MRRWWRRAGALLLVVVVLLAAGGVVTQTPPPPAASAQYVRCRVSTEQLEATASAELVSLCSTKELENELSHFEKQVMATLEVMHTTLASLESKLAIQGKSFEKFFQPRKQRDLPQGYGKTSAKAIDGQHGLYKEMSTYNHPGSIWQKRVFEYQWNVTGLRHDSLRSPSFYTSPRGYRMYLRLRPHNAGQSVFVYAGLTRGDYDHALSWPFLMRHKVEVVLGREVMESRMWDPAGLCRTTSWQRPRSGDNPECVGFAFPRFGLQQNNVTIKLMVLLD